MNVYIVLKTTPDNFGGFDTVVAGVYKDIQDAYKCIRELEAKSDPYNGIIAELHGAELE